ncbi:MAG: GDSL-type esterase/lipase family protein [Paludibacter sp.]
MYWYEDEIIKLEGKTILPKENKKRVLFYGSSSIRQWETLENDFPEFDVVNQAFGGSTIAACCWFFERIIPFWKPDILVLYAGDNDLGDGRHPEEVFLNFNYMMSLIQEHCGDIPVAFISIKQSISRINLYDSIQFTNKIIRNEIELKYPLCTFVDITEAMKTKGSVDNTLFESDGLHLSTNGYKVWKREIKLQFLNNWKEKIITQP